MLTVTRIADTDYYEHLAATEYYSTKDRAAENEGEPQGVWAEGIDQIGVKGGSLVDSTELKKIMSGFDLDNKKLVQNAGKNDAVFGLDLTFSAPKSVSVLWANAGAEMRDQISKIQAESVTKAMDFLRHKIEVRRGRGEDGEQLKEAPKALIYARFEHCNTRENDPQLHTHVVVSNAVIRQDNSTGAMSNREIFENQKSADALYKSNFAASLKNMGFKIERDEDLFKTSERKNDSFRVTGVPAELEAHFSKRSQAIDKIAEEKGIESRHGKQVIALSTRAKKGAVNRRELFQTWQQESKEHGFDTSKIDVLKQAEPTMHQALTGEELAQKLTQNESFFSPKDVELHFAELSQYQEIDIQKSVSDFLADEECLLLSKSRTWIDKKGQEHEHIETSYTTKEMRDLEQQIIDTAERQKEDTVHQLDPQAVDQLIAKNEASEGFQYNEEQRQAIIDLTTAKGSIALVKGKAGAGKTTALKPAVQAYKAQGYQVHGATISAKAAKVLGAETGLKTDTIKKMLIDLDSGKLKFTKNSLLILDEAGMIGSRDFSKLQQAVDAAGAKLIAVGDENQVQAIDAGGIFYGLQKHANLAASELTKINRQKSETQRQASQYFSEGKAAEALKIYEENNQLFFSQNRSGLMVKLAFQFVNDPTPLKEKIALTGSRDEAFQLNQQIRQSLIDKGVVDVFESAQLKNHDDHKLVFSKNDRVIFKKNDRAKGIQNGLLGTIKNIRQIGKNARLTIEDDAGKEHVIDSQNYNAIRHSYAITTHASQGSTFDNAYVLFNRNSDANLGYVAMTRHRQIVRLYAQENDRELISEKFSKLNLKGTSLDFQIQEKEPSKPEPTPTQALKTPQIHVRQSQATQAKAQPQNTSNQIPATPPQKINWALLKEKSPSLFLMFQNLMESDSKASQALGESVAASHSRALEREEEKDRGQDRQHQETELEM